MKIIKDIFDSKKSQKNNNSNDLMYILIVLFLLIITIIIFYCIQSKSKSKSNFKNINEGYQNSRDVIDILGNQNTEFVNNEPQCKFSTYLFNKENINKDFFKGKSEKTLEFYNSDNNNINLNFGDVIEVSNVINNVSSNKYFYLKKEVSINKIKNKLDTIYMDVNEQEKIRINNNDIITKIVINDKIEQSLKTGSQINNTYKVLKGLKLLDPKSNQLNYNFEKILDFFDINALVYQSKNPISLNNSGIIDFKDNKLYNLEEELKKKIENKEDKNQNNNYIRYLLNIIDDKNEVNLDLPLTIIQLNTNDDDEYVCLGDIIYCNINNEPIDAKYINDTLKYRKIPRRCLNEIGEYKEENIIYQFKVNNNNIPINIYQHPIYKTFKAYYNDNSDKKPIYEIIPCVNKITKYEDKIKSYEALKKKCRDRNKNKEINTRMSKADKYFKLETQKMISINQNNIKNMRNKLQNLKKEINTNDNIRHNFNRHKLQQINNMNTENLNLGLERLHSKLNSYDLNIEFEDLSKYKNIQEKLKRLNELKTNNGVEPNDQKIEENQEIQQLSEEEIKDKCNLEDYFHKDKIHCYLSP